MKVKQTLAELKEQLKPMTWKQRIEHLWEYYKWVLAVAALVIVLICTVCTSIYNKNVELLLGGAVVNVYMQEETEAYLQEDVEQLLNMGKMQQVYVNYVSLGDMSKNEAAATSAMSVAARVAARELDFAIMDESSLNYFINTAVVNDLTKALTEEQLAMFEGKTVLARLEEDGPVVPVALDITDIDFLKDCYIGDRKVYLSFPNNTEHAMTPSEFLDYLLAYEPVEP